MIREFTGPMGSRTKVDMVNNTYSSDSCWALNCWHSTGFNTAGNFVDYLFAQGNLEITGLKYTDSPRASALSSSTRACDCGGAKAKTTHSHWCSLNG